MTQVVIQPSYGNTAARQHWKDTLDKKVDFRVHERMSVLTSEQRTGLNNLHTAGTARFWGATANHDTRMSSLRIGDVILFTGQKVVRAVGEVGFSFHNEAFADMLWHPDPKRGSYSNVYSLLSFQSTRIPYEEIWELPGFNSGDNFMGLRFLDEAKGDVLLDALHIDTVTSSRQAAERERIVTAALAADTERLVDAEAVNVAHTSYESEARTVLVHRAEALLVARFRATLSEVWTGRMLTSSGVTDMYIQHADGVEIVEAKRDSSHGFVREALGQLLDYVFHCSSPVIRLTGLFPALPNDADVQMLHHYGIDCLYEAGDGSFERIAATRAWRSLSAGVWAR